MSVDVEQVVRENIDKIVHMSLATASGDAPWVCEVHFAYDNNLSLYFVSLPQTRHCQEISVNPNVAGSIVKQHDLTESPNGIYFEGTAVALEIPSAGEIKSYCDRLSRDTVELSKMLTEPEGHRMYKITVKNWAAFGKFGSEKNEKYQLAWNGGKK